ncbi:efflux transporter, RND family, MFP subunit [Nitrosococcus halophilus Nc 4]|uniref:Efflux transporter, RND family, MFP subunit n=1 Tax=Nitrosococcus halophilus (strain Nc4) TaxID=472759 RepID=D5BY31_NITHN|nr:efflux RND transporter periplasmic adaptor subunit [Nitrosococcus halophilus]ADE15942.1 efflux transporter, RND family, MFP subunit [Nitrosococcus halophilus Nc 4]
MKRYFRYFTAVLGVLVLVAGIFLFLHLRPLAVEIALPQRNIPVQIYGLGTVEARIASEIGFKVAGTLAELHADHGDPVSAQATVARLQQTEQQAQVSRAAAAVSRAMAELKRTRARVEQAQAALVQKQQANRRQQALAARQMVSVETAEETQTEVEIAEAELAVAQSEVAVAAAALSEAQGTHKLEAVRLAHHTLTSPYEGLVVERHKELGTVLAPGEPVFTLIDSHTVWVQAYVDEGRAGELQVGQPAEIRLRSLPHEVFSGQIARIGIESDQVSEERRAYVAFENIPDSFHLHEQAEVLITTGWLEIATLVPQTAVEAFKGTQGQVWTVEDGRLAKREVQLGRQTLDGRLEIVAGLSADAGVVTTLVPGMRQSRWVTVDREAEK